MADKVQFELVSPERLLVSRAVEMVVIPGGEGDFGVLPGHAPLISTIRPGVIAIHDDGKITERLFVAGGFAEVTPDRCAVLAEEATPVDKLDRAALETELRDIKDDMAAAKDDAARAAVDPRQRIADAKLQALSGA